jgi:hypothetical protein
MRAKKEGKGRNAQPEPAVELVDLTALLPKLKNALDAISWGDHQSGALYHLLTAYQGKIGKFQPWYFHKAFRQIDVTDDGHIDGAIWHLLNGSKTFWDVFTEMYFKDEKGE